MTGHRLPLTVAAAILLASLAPSFAAAEDDFVSLYNRYLFHTLAKSPKSAAMGNAYTGLRSPEMSFYGNPAALGFLEERYIDLGGEFEEIVGTSSMDLGAFSDSTESDVEMWGAGIGFAYPFEWGGVAINYNYRDDDGESHDYDFIPSFNTTFMDESELERHSVSLTGAYRVDDQLSVGYRYSYITYDREIALIDTGAFPNSVIGTDDQDFDGHRQHIGGQYMVNDCLTLGLEGMYGLGELDFDNGGDADADSWFFRGGFAYCFLDQLPLSVAADFKFENYEIDGAGRNVDQDIWGIHLGAEYEVYENFYLRGGYQFEDFDYEDISSTIEVDQGINGFTGGLGYHWNQISVDYGVIWADTGDGGDLTHVFGVGYSF